MNSRATLVWSNFSGMKTLELHPMGIDAGKWKKGSRFSKTKAGPLSLDELSFWNCHERTAWRLLFRKQSSKLFVKNIERRAERRIKDILLIEKLKNSCQYEGANGRTKKGAEKSLRKFLRAIVMRRRQTLIGREDWLEIHCTVNGRANQSAHLESFLLWKLAGELICMTLAKHHAPRYAKYEI